MKYYIIKMMLLTAYHDTMVIAHADNLIDARSMVDELWATGNDENITYGILPTIAHSSGQVEQDQTNAM